VDTKNNDQNKEDKKTIVHKTLHFKRKLNRERTSMTGMVILVSTTPLVDRTYV
jgi:hypothetical protein